MATIVTGKGSLVRFVAFVAVVATLTWYVAIKFGEFRAAQLAEVAPVTASGDVEQIAGDFFIDFRMAREQARSQQVEMLQELGASPTADPEARKQAQLKLIAVTERIEKELELESLIRSKNIADVLVFLQDNAAQVIVRAARLTQEEAARIGDIVMRATGLKPDRITIQAKGN